MNVKGPGQDCRWNEKYRSVLRPGVQHGTLDDQSEANVGFLLQMADIFKDMAEADRGQRGCSKINSVYISYLFLQNIRS